MDPEFRRHFYGALNAMPLDRAQEQGVVIAHLRCVRDGAMEHAGGGVEELEKEEARAARRALPGELARLNRRLLVV